ncbi:MAG: serine hydrolase domain-containing protein [Saprospiraceae bacterium]
MRSLVLLRYALVGILPLLCSVLSPSCAHAPAAPAYPPLPAAPPLEPHLQALVDDYDRYFSAAMAATQTPGAALVIVKDDRIIWMRGYGAKVGGGRDSVDANTLFRIGSLSKGFAGVLTGILAQDSLLRLDDPVQQYFPEFTLRDKQQAARIRLWHLLSHTTGLPYHAYTNMIEAGYDIRRIITEYFPKARLGGREGDFFSYQNVAFCGIEEVMLSATGKKYPQLLHDRIFQPADMRTASCDFGSITASSNKALPHFQTGSGWQPGEISPLYYNAAAAGGVNASIADMGEWLKLLLGHKPDIASALTLDRVFRPVTGTGKERRIFPGWLDREEASYALGWRVLRHDGDTIVYHGGYVNGYKGEIALCRRDGIGICALFNANSELSKRCVPEFFERWKQQKGVAEKR